ncbi:hypothetical protein EPO44_12765 [bacterium]|nr:MAG: hypothetical protein EPO44_12765 [bacterium]
MWRYWGCGAIAEAQQTSKVSRIGVLVPTSPSAGAGNIKAFQQGLRELGYVEGKNIIIEYRYAEGRIDTLSELADELVRLKVDVIVTNSRAAILAAKTAPKRSPLSSPRLPTQWRMGSFPA